MELEADLEARLRVASVRVQVDRVGDDARSGLQQPAGQLIEDVGVAADFVHGPRRDAVAVLQHELEGQLGVLGHFAQHARAPDHVVEHVAAADGLAAGAAARHVVDLANLDRRDVAILGQAGRDALDLAPPVGRVALDQQLVARHDQIGLADAPVAAVGELQRRRHRRRDCRAARRCRPTSRSSRSRRRSATGRPCSAGCRCSSRCTTAASRRRAGRCRCAA